MNQNTKPVFALKAAVVLCMGLAAGLPSWAESPLGLALSETLTYDTNILKDDSRKSSDTVASTAVKVFLDKDYGRQNYRASVTGILQRYKNLEDYDNDGYNIDLGFSSQLAANGLVEVEHSRAQTLQDLSGQGLTRFKETLKSTNTAVNGRYGLYGKWGLSGTVSHDTLGYDVQATQDQVVNGARVGVRYSPTDLLFFDLGVRKSTAEYEDYLVTYINDDGLLDRQYGEEVRRTDLSLISRWIVTGYSSLDAQLNLTRERYQKDDARDFSGWTGRANWRFTPRGKISYALAIDRDTNNSGGSTAIQYANILGQVIPIGAGQTAQRRLSTGIYGSATWQATSKISANASLTYRRLEDARINVGNGEQESLSGNYRAMAVGLTYTPKRYLSFDCKVNSYKRDGTVLAVGYSGESLACSATFLID